SRRHGVIVASIADQRCRRHARRPDLAGFEWSRRKLPECSNISHKPHSDRLAVATGAFRLPRPAINRQLRVQRVIALRDRYRREELPPPVLDQVLDLPLVIALAWPAEAIGKQIM